MQLVYVKNPKWVDKEKSGIECLVKFTTFDEMPFHATPDDVMGYGKQIFADCVAGKYGVVQEYTPPPVENLDPAKQGGPKIVA
jgi:hypothetical protein